MIGVTHINKEDMIFSEKVAIVLPVWKQELTSFEEISFKQCCFVLKKYPFVLVTWKGLNIDGYLSSINNEGIVYKIIYFNKKYFLNTRTYSKLMISLFFYISFMKFQYILIYQLDCFVFKDDLLFWIERKYSYIGAPWLEGYSLAQYGSKVVGVGNGGLSLRNVKDHLKVLLSFRCITDEEKNYMLYRYVVRNNTFFLINNYKKNEDIFWSHIAPRQFSWFKIPEWKIASLFSVEVQPRYFFDINKRIPFGCHAWWTYDIDFWKPHIESFGYKI